MSAFADLSSAARKVRELEDGGSLDYALDVLEDYSKAARAYARLDCCHCGNAEVFSPGRFLGAYYIATCRLCNYIHIKDVPLALAATR